MREMPLLSSDEESEEESESSALSRSSTSPLAAFLYNQSLVPE